MTVHRRVRHRVQGTRSGQSGPHRGAEEGARGAHRGRRADVHAARDCAAEAAGRVPASEHRQVSVWANLLVTSLIVLKNSFILYYINFIIRNALYNNQTNKVTRNIF